MKRHCISKPTYIRGLRSTVKIFNFLSLCFGSTNGLVFVRDKSVVQNENWSFLCINFLIFGISCYSDINRCSLSSWQPDRGNDLKKYTQQIVLLEDVKI